VTVFDRLSAIRMHMAPASKLQKTIRRRAKGPEEERRSADAEVEAAETAARQAWETRWAAARQSAEDGARWARVDAALRAACATGRFDPHARLSITMFGAIAPVRAAALCIALTLTRILALTLALALANSPSPPARSQLARV
jgi:hypothetical protein